MSSFQAGKFRCFFRHSCWTKTKNQRAKMHPATFVSGIWASKDKTFAVAVVCKKWRSSFCVWDLILLCSTSDCQLIMRLAQDVGRVGMQLLPSIFCKVLKNRALGIHYSDGIQLWCQRGWISKDVRFLFSDLSLVGNWYFVSPSGICVRKAYKL